MKNRFLVLLFCFKLFLASSLAFAEKDNSSNGQFDSEASQISSPALSNGCPDPLTGKFPGEVGTIIASDGTTAPCPMKSRSVKPLGLNATSNKKWTEYNKAVLESDFKRVITLFKNCAARGDGLCQYLLAEGVTEWLGRTDVAKDPKYDRSYADRWLRKAFRSDQVLRLVSSSYSTSFKNGYGGFPEDDELSECWRQISNAPKSYSRMKLRKMANLCGKLSLKKHGIHF